MFNKRKGNIPNIPIKIIALLCSILSVICFSIRLFSVVKGKKENIELFAAEFILPDADKASLQQEMKIVLHLKLKMKIIITKTKINIILLKVSLVKVE